MNDKAVYITAVATPIMYHKPWAHLPQVKNGTFAPKMKHLPRDFWDICSKDGTFAPVKKSTFALKTKYIFFFKVPKEKKKAPQVP